MVLVAMPMVRGLERLSLISKLEGLVGTCYAFFI